MNDTNFNAHKLFTNSAGNGYINALDISTSDWHRLRSARDELRDAIRNGFANPTAFILKSELITEDAIRKNARAEINFKPRFLMQGSCAYKTVNDPAKPPKQQIDLDDGVYLPLSFMDNESPVIAASGYFKIVEASIADLCLRKGWTIVPDQPSCVRVLISTKMHIDLPLYVIPDDKFAEVERELANSFGYGLDESFRLSKVYDEHPSIGRLPSDKIMLARRENGTYKWEHSDPKQIHEWFQGKVALHEPLRRVCRYLKGWRDNLWTESKLSSITLMKCVVDIFDEIGHEFPQNRDDLILLRVTNRLPAMLEGDIQSPLESVTKPLNQWTDMERSRYINAAKALNDSLHAALNNTYDESKGQIRAVEELRKSFGDRMPDKPDVVAKIENDRLTRQVLSAAATTTPVPLVKASTSG